MAITFERLGSALGARVHGLDLREALDPASHVALHRGLLEHQVLILRDQLLTPRQQRDVAAHFGDLHIHPIYPKHPEQQEILVLDTELNDLRDNALWHTDVTFIQTPPLGSLLSARQVPAYGGDTLWASNSAAYAALSAPLREWLDGLSAWHDLSNPFHWNASAIPRKACKASTRHAPPIRRYAIRWYGYIRKPGSRDCSSAPASPLGSTSWKRPKAMRCCSCCSPTPPDRSSRCAGNGGRATWPSGTIASPSTMPVTTIVLSAA